MPAKRRRNTTANSSSMLDTVVKCVCVGDGAVGKTCLLIVYAKGDFPKEYVPTIFDNYACNVTVNEKEYVFQLFDTAGQEDYDRLRPLAYPSTHVFVVCFAIDRPDSLDNVRTKWVPEIRHYCKDAPFILVGTRMDKREDPNLTSRPVSYVQGFDMAKKVKAAKYLECSALKQKGVKKVFDEALLVALSKHNRSGGNRNHQSCVLL